LLFVMFFAAAGGLEFRRGSRTKHNNRRGMGKELFLKSSWLEVRFDLHRDRL